MIDLDNYRERMIDTMYDYHVNALKKLSKIVDASHVDEFAKILSYSFNEELPEAQTIADKLNFRQIDFAALALDEKSFTDLFMQEIEDNYIENYG